MPTANPLEQLRRRMQSHASPAAFAAAAEEHRRAGRFAEAIAVCRDGLDRYPAYASARVTLGRALLDSGDAAGAVAELEQAVAQAPDNLAASRALEAARAALGDLAEVPAPVAATPLDPVANLPLQVSIAGAADDADPWHIGASADAASSHAPVADLTTSAVGEALDLVADSPQEFGLGPDWLPTGPGFGPDPHLPPLPVEVPPPALTDTREPTAADGPLQGDEPAGIWPAPQLDSGDLDAPAGAPVYSWAVDPALPVDSPESPVSASSIWDEPTIVAPYPTEASDTERPADVPAAAAEPEDLSADPGGNGQWTGLFVEPVHDGAAPAVFSGWEAGGPSGRDVPTWSDAPAAEPVTSAFTVPGLWGDAPGAADARAEAPAIESPLPPASHTPEWLAAEPPVDASAATPEAMGEWTMVTPTPAVPVFADAAAAGDAPIEPQAPASGAVVAELPAAPIQAPSMWDGSVASALDEVFARAGCDGANDHASLEPPTHPNVALREALTETAVEATLEDVAQQGDALPPALVALQQMLDAVRARRAALHDDMKH